jgi:RNA polymerase sigma factor (sigma-70 family)
MQDLMLAVGPLIPGLRRYARALLRDRPAADDLVQDCLERVVARWQQRREDDSVRAWVFSILHNLAIRRFRQNARPIRLFAIEDAGDAAMASAPMQERGLQRQELLRALDTLPEDAARQREVEEYVDHHPDAARRLSAFAEQRSAPRAALAPVAEEPVPPGLDLARMPRGAAQPALLPLALSGCGGRAARPRRCRRVARAWPGGAGRRDCRARPGSGGELRSLCPGPYAAGRVQGDLSRNVEGVLAKNIGVCNIVT